MFPWPIWGAEGKKGPRQCSQLSLPPATPQPRWPARSLPRCSSSAPQPRSSLEREGELNNRFLVNRRDAKIMGVAAGIADYTGIDPLIVRLGLVAALLLTGPIVLIL